MGLYESAQIIQKWVMQDDTRLSVRCPIPVKAGIEQAAECLGLNLTGYVLMNLREAAAKTLRAHGKPVPFLDLPKQQTEVISETVSSPPRIQRGKRGVRDKQRGE